MDSLVTPVTIGSHHKMPHKTASKGGWNAAIFIIFVEMAERFAFYGLAGNLITYLTNNLGEPVVLAVKNVNTWVGVSANFPLVGAFVADSYLGRFKTILASSFIYFMGMVLLSLSVSIIPMHSRKPIFFTALYILAIGEGGHKPCVQTFAADQFDEKTAEEKAEKSSFFNWWYFGIIMGASVAIVVVIYLQDNVSWAAEFGVLARSLAVALAIFLIGMKKYRKQRPTGSPFTTVAQVFVAAARKWHLSETHGGGGICYEDDRSQTMGHNRTCSCRAWDLSGIPCPHAVAIFRDIEHDAEQYVHKCYWRTTQLAITNSLINPVIGPKQWEPIPEMEPIVPPRLIRPNGRPKKSRNKEPGEVSAPQATKMARQHHGVKCSKCGLRGHNKKSCKGPVNIRPTKLTVRRKTFVRPRNTSTSQVESTVETSNPPTQQSQANKRPREE